MRACSWQIKSVVFLEAFKPRPNGRNISTQHIAVLLGRVVVSISRFFLWPLLLAIEYFVFLKVKASATMLRALHTRNNSTQHSATLLFPTCCTATLLQHVTVCWMSQIELVRMLRCNNVARICCTGCCANVAKRVQHYATSKNVERCSERISWWPNVCSMLYPTILRYVSLNCCERLTHYT